MAERTPHGRYIVIDGRRWRASDPPSRRSAGASRSRSSCPPGGRWGRPSAWFFMVFPALTLNYLGQGALIL